MSKNPKTFEEFVQDLVSQGYIVEKESNDIDIVRPEISIVVSGKYDKPGENIFPRGLNMIHFDKDSAESFAEECRQAGFESIWIHGNHLGQFTHKTQKYTTQWWYEVEIAPEE